MLEVFVQVVATFGMSEATTLWCLPFSDTWKRHVLGFLKRESFALLTHTKSMIHVNKCHSCTMWIHFPYLRNCSQLGTPSAGSQGTLAGVGCTFFKVYYTAAKKKMSPSFWPIQQKVLKVEPQDVLKVWHKSADNNYGSGSQGLHCDTLKSMLCHLKV